MAWLDVSVDKSTEKLPVKSAVLPQVLLYAIPNMNTSSIYSMLNINFSLKHTVEVSFIGMWMSIVSYDLLKTIVDIPLVGQVFY